VIWHDIAFIGSYGHAPNQDAARWLIGQNHAAFLPAFSEFSPCPFS
jgi:hypothetical protein